MEVILLESGSEQARGLQDVTPIPDDTLFFFPNVMPGSVFHSRNVREPFDLAFVTAELHILEVWRVTPPDQVVKVPAGARAAVEAKAGVLPRWHFMPGKTLSF